MSEIEDVFKDGLNCEEEAKISDITDLIMYMADMLKNTPLFEEFKKKCQTVKSEEDAEYVAYIFMIDLMVSIVATLVENFGKEKTAKA